MDEEIRRRAVDILQRRGWEHESSFSAEDVTNILNELSIHQVELELQNEELRRAQIELELSRQRYYELYNLAPVGYFSTDLEGKIVDINLKAADLFGQPLSRVKGNNVVTLLARESAVAISRHCRSVIETVTPQMCRASIVTAQRKLRYIQFLSVPWLLDGEPVGVRSTMEDISDQVKAEMETQAYRERMEQLLTDLRSKNKEYQAVTEKLRMRNDDLAQLAFSASHDLRAPLRTVSSYNKRLAVEYADILGEDGLHLINQAIEGIGMMDVVIAGLISYGRLGTFTSPFTNFDLEDAVTEVRKILKADIAASEAYITYDHLPLICGDWQQIKLLFQNLIDNSIKYRSKKRPIIHIAVRQAPEPEFWQLSVHDNGIGFDPRYKDRAFRMFKQLTKGVEGAGIGLAQCKRIVENHGGKMWVETNVGQGAVFYFTLPKQLDLPTVRS